MQLQRSNFALVDPGMIIFISEDDAYLRWLAEHPRGFVVNAHRRPTSRYLMLHRASCADISSNKRSHWTTADYIKICARRALELEAWAEAEFGGHLRRCARCRPAERRASPQVGLATGEAEETHHLTKLGDHLLSFVLEVAVMSLDAMANYQADPPTVGALAQYEGKSIRQIAPALSRLLEDGFITIDGDTSPEAKRRRQSIVYPTAAALRTVPAFAELTANELDRALASLQGDTAKG